MLVEAVAAYTAGGQLDSPSYSAPFESEAPKGDGGGTGALDLMRATVSGDVSNDF